MPSPLNGFTKPAASPVTTKVGPTRGRTDPPVGRRPPVGAQVSAGELAQFLAIVLRKEGYQVSTVQNGRDALEKVKLENFDVVITDIRMPGMDGIQLLQGIKKHDPGLPVVIMTAYASQQSAIDAVNLGAFQYLLKNGMNQDYSWSIDIYVVEYGLRLANFSLATAGGIFKSLVNIILLFTANTVASRLGQERLVCRPVPRV